MLSMASLHITMQCNGVDLCSGTGFIGVGASGRRALVTNYHNLAQRFPHDGRPMRRDAVVPDSVRIRHVAEIEGRSFIDKVEPVTASDGSPKWVEHPVHGRQVDVVALPVNDVAGATLVDLIHSVADEGRQIVIGPAEIVSIIGFPFGLRPGGLAVWSTGFIASEPELDVNGLPMLLVDSRTRQGQSGAPVFAVRAANTWTPLTDGRTSLFEHSVNRFLGIYSGRVNEESDLGRVWKPSAIHEVLATL